MNTTAIITAGGKGIRLNKKVPKQFLEICGKPLLYYTIEKFQQCPAVDEIILVTPDGVLNESAELFINKESFPKIRKIVAGGKERYQSVYNGLCAANSSTEIIVIHDGVRPFISPVIIEQAITLCLKHDAVIVAMPVKDTIKEAKNGVVSKTLQRNKLWATQTPQVFKYNLLFEAYKKNIGKKHPIEITDDAMLVEKSGHPVKILQGAYSNIKVTSPDDFEWVKFVIETGLKVH